MGVRGLKSFIEKNDDLLIKEYNLSDTHVVIDACNLISSLIKQSQKHERRDLFGGDMVQFGRFVAEYFENLIACKIVPILVFDGAQTYDQDKLKTVEKQRRAIERFRNVMSVNRFGFGDFILPATATNVFRSIAVDYNLRLVQCMFEADLEIARLANELCCPVISNDSDFFLMKLPYGLITTDLLEHRKIIRANNTDQCYLRCSLFKQERFINYLPDLDLSTLPLVGVLAGNDFIKSKVLEQFCSSLPLQAICDRGDMTSKRFRKITNRQHEKILKILHFLSGKSLARAINIICERTAKDRRLYLKTLISSNLRVYEIPAQDDFRDELDKLYRRSFERTYAKVYIDAEVMRLMFRETMNLLNDWLKRAFERSVLAYRCLELAHKNTIFIQSHMDDPQLPSAHSCQYRFMRVMLQLLRAASDDKRPCVVYDRKGESYVKLLIRPLDKLTDDLKLDYLVFDLPKLDEQTRKTILIGTFHSSLESIEDALSLHSRWFDINHAEEVISIKLLMDYIDTESGGTKLWKHFRQATLVCYIYHLFKRRCDSFFQAKLDELELTDTMSQLCEIVRRRRYHAQPMLNKKRLYSCRIMHQITQLQSSIISFNMLNAFLGDTMNRIRTEHWLNSCLIYNIAEGLQNKSFRLPDMPDIIYERL